VSADPLKKGTPLNTHNGDIYRFRKSCHSSSDAELNPTRETQVLRIEHQWSSSQTNIRKITNHCTRNSTQTLSPSPSWWNRQLHAANSSCKNNKDDNELPFYIFDLVDKDDTGNYAEDFTGCQSALRIVSGWES
jgi:hypothetical protein